MARWLWLGLVAVAAVAAAQPVVPEPVTPALRLGASAGVGVFAPGPQAYGDVEVRAGLRVGPRMTAYLRGAASAGEDFASVARLASYPPSSAGFWLVGANIEGETDGRGVFVAAGPQVGSGGWRHTPSAFADYPEQWVAEGLNFGAELRVGTNLSMGGPHFLRPALGLSFLLATDARHSSGGFGGGSVAQSSGMSVAVTLQLGYELELALRPEPARERDEPPVAEGTWSVHAGRSVGRRRVVVGVEAGYPGGARSRCSASPIGSTSASPPAVVTRRSRGFRTPDSRRGGSRWPRCTCTPRCACGWSTDGGPASG